MMVLSNFFRDQIFEEMQPAGYSDPLGSLALTMVMTLTPIPMFEQRQRLRV